jgi:hypothetical protein
MKARVVAPGRSAEMSQRQVTKGVKRSREDERDVVQKPGQLHAILEYQQEGIAKLSAGMAAAYAWVIVG